MVSFCLRPAILAAALSVTACGCNPPIGQPASRVLIECGRPDAVYAAPATSDLTHEEWAYGDTYVGLIDGHVAYVLK